MVRGAGTLSRVRKLWEDSARMVTEGETSVELPFGHLPAAIPVKNTSYELLNSTFLQTRIANFYSHFKEKKTKNLHQCGLFSCLFERMELCHF